MDSALFYKVCLCWGGGGGDILARTPCIWTPNQWWYDNTVNEIFHVYLPLVDVVWGG